MTGISVIIPTYNRAGFLGRALASVKRQTRRCDEIIVVDDGSDDDTRDCVQEFASNCLIPLHYICQINKGPAAARNLGIKSAKHSYLTFLDSDDHWNKKKLDLQYKALEANPEILISHTKERWLRRGEHLNQKKIHQPGNGDIFKHCLQLCAVGMSTVMVRKELFNTIGIFNEAFRCCEDYDLWLRVSSQFPFFLIDTPLTVKEGGREDQVSYQYRIGMDRLRIAAILDLLKKGALREEQIKWTLEELQRKCQVYGMGCLKHEREQEGESYLDIEKWSRKCLSSKMSQISKIPENPEVFEKTSLDKY
jgi:glycosyltransferase involved in cell wall biosynthesis